ncbi:unnamed protein product [Gemmata massiliana]|uniref:Gliding motility-associated protein GldM C-terminal domain-containing protein n=1 Tax=Gemmata massiliana TaxID=1210884 RepID=A0A6P2CWR3_9BACT|nr:hypothetical protein [Gemmata massiliana]VTR92154.1 unnamed protein product [Gemmata massiliana]
MERRLTGLLTITLVSMSPSAFGQPTQLPVAPEPTPIETRTYQVKARIKNNAGITPFKVGELITVRFTYDINSKKLRSDDSYAHRVSKRNKMTFASGETKFAATEDIIIAVSSGKYYQTLNFVANDLELPEGWETNHKRGRQHYVVMFQTLTPEGVITGNSIPDRFSLSDFKDTAEVRLNFVEGVKFPGGEVKRGVVMCKIESLEEVKH